MILIDTGPLVGLLNRSDSHHAESIAAARELQTQVLITTWPCFTETMYFLGKLGGFTAQALLWSLIGSGQLRIHSVAADRLTTVQRLMAQYRDFPMALADATLLVAAMDLKISRVITFDQGFQAFRLDDGSLLEVLPQTNH